MLLRLSLIIAILAGLGAFFVTHTQVKEKIDTLTTELGDMTAQKDKANEEASTAKKNETKALEELTTTKKNLGDKTAALTATESRLAEQLARANKSAADLIQVTASRNEAQVELSQWKSFGLTPPQILELVNSSKKTKEEITVLADENKLLNAKAKDLATQLLAFQDPNKEPEMPVGLKGKILAVDPKFSFVVLDIGSDQGAVQRGKLLISREGRLVGAVRITRLEANRSVANLIPEMTPSEILEGDQVVY